MGQEDLRVVLYCGRGIRSQQTHCLQDSSLEPIWHGLGSWWFPMEHPNSASISIVRDGEYLVVCRCGLRTRNHRQIHCGIFGSTRNIGPIHHRKGDSSFLIVVMMMMIWKRTCFEVQRQFANPGWDLIIDCTALCT